MPIEYRIDHEQRLVWAKGRGTFTDQDVFSYQREVWARPDVVGYDELVDMSAVEHIESPAPERVLDLATLSAVMDSRHGRSKFAIVAPGTLAFGLGRMYQAYRELDRRSTKTVAVFHSVAEALEWLGREPEAGAGPPSSAP